METKLATRQVTSGGGNIAKTLLVPITSEIIDNGVVGITYGSYTITGVLSLTVLGNGNFIIL